MKGSVEQKEEKMTESTDNSVQKKEESKLTRVAGMLNTEGLKCYDAESAPYRFDTFDESARKYLSENGFVAIANVLSKEEIKDAKLLLWDFIESNCKMKEGNIETWDDDNFMNICGESMSAMIWDMGASQSEFMWYLRTHPKVIDSFVKAWNVESYQDLLCSMDGFCLFRPWHYSQAQKTLASAKDEEGIDYCRRYWKTKNQWYHVDQNPKKKPNFECLQGYVSLLDQNEYTGGTTIVEKSHLDFKQYISDYATPYDGDWIMIPQSCDKIMNERRNRILICVKAGDLVIWDSRLVHCSSPAIALKDIEKKEEKQDSNSDDNNDNNNKNDSNKDKNDKNDKKGDKNEIILGKDKSKEIDFIRIVSMITYSPKSKVKSADIYGKRVEAYMKQMSTSHWPHEFHILAKPAIGVAKWSKMKLKNVGELKQDANKVRASLIGYPEYLKMNPE